MGKGFGFRAMSAAVAAAALVGAAAPAAARDHRGWRGHHYRHHDRGIGTVGGLILGAAVIGGIAAIASNNRRERDLEYARDYGTRYQDGAAPPSAYDDLTRDESFADTPAADPVADCSRAAERRAQADGGFARVASIGRIDRIEGGAEIVGELEIDRGRDVPLGRIAFACTATFGEVTRLRLG